MSSLRVFTCKRNLYVALLELENDQLSDSDINLMYYLSRDREIQDYLSDAIKSQKEQSND